MSTQNSQKRILVVEDSPTQLKKLELSLTQAGYEVVTATNGVEGINQAYTKSPDLIISDILMPELNGYQFCRLIKNDPLRQHIPVILLTNLGEPQDRFWGIEAGADGYIVKEHGETELIPKIESLLARSTAPTPPIPQHEGQSSRHKSRANYMLDKLVMESTISVKIREVAKSTENSEQLMANFFDLLYKLVDYSLAQLLIRSKQYYYCNMDIQEEVGLTRDVISAASYKVSQQIKMGIPPQRQQVLIIHEENILPEADKSSLASRLQTEIIFPFLVEEDTTAILAIHSTEANAYNKDTEDTLRIIGQQLGVVIKYFLALEQNTQGRQWYIYLLSNNINRHFKKIARCGRQLAEELAGKVDEERWHSVRQLTDIAEDSQRAVMEIISSLKPQK